MRKTTRVYGAALWAIEDAPNQFTVDDIDYPNRQSVLALVNQLVREGRIRRLARRYSGKTPKWCLPSIFEKLEPIVSREEVNKLKEMIHRYESRHF